MDMFEVEQTDTLTRKEVVFERGGMEFKVNVRRPCT